MSTRRLATIIIALAVGIAWGIIYAIQGQIIGYILVSSIGLSAIILIQLIPSDKIGIQDTQVSLPTISLPGEPEQIKFPPIRFNVYYKGLPQGYIFVESRMSKEQIIERLNHFSIITYDSDLEKVVQEATENMVVEILPTQTAVSLLGKETTLKLDVCACGSYLTAESICPNHKDVRRRPSISLARVSLLPLTPYLWGEMSKHLDIGNINPWYNEPFKEFTLQNYKDILIKLKQQQ